MNEIYLYGTVGAEFWDEEFFTALEVRDQLAEMVGEVTVHLNSGGGVASVGQAIYHMLKAHEGKIHVVIDGEACSAASLIAMAGDTRTMRAGTYMMIHDPANWMVDGRGTERDHLRAAQALGILAGGYAAVYASAAGITPEAAREIMKSETWYDGDAALAQGFVTHVDEDIPAVAAARFDYGLYANAPQQLLTVGAGISKPASRTAVMAIMAGFPAPHPKGQTMKDEDDKSKVEDQDEATAEDDQDEDDDPNAAADGGDADDDEAESGSDDDDIDDGDDEDEDDDEALPTAVQIMDLGTSLKRPASEARDMIMRGLSIEAAAVEFNATMRKENPMGKTKLKSQSPARVTADARDKFKKGAQLSLMFKAGHGTGERNEFSSLSLSELARASIEMAGEKARFDDRRTMVSRAFTMAGSHTTSDFAEILSNVMGKAALKGWEEAEETFDLWTTKGTLTDFKATKRVGAGLFGALPMVEEGADYTHGTVGDRGEDIVLATYGKLLRISRQAIINDDLSILGRLPMKMGRAARHTIGNLVYGVLTSNPTMADGKALFHADHNNLAASGGALAVSTFDAGRTAMRTQKDEDAVLNITPSYLIVPAALESTAEVLMTSTVDPRDAKGHATNPVAGKATVVSDGRLDAKSATAWYLAGNPAAFDTIEVAYLDGNDTPYLEEQTAWSSDGVEMKVRIDAGVSPLDFRPFYKNAGA